jgi:hypothetical protein
MYIDEVDLAAAIEALLLPPKEVAEYLQAYMLARFKRQKKERQLLQTDEAIVRCLQEDEQDAALEDARDVILRRKVEEAEQAEQAEQVATDAAIAAALAGEE